MSFFFFPNSSFIYFFGFIALVRISSTIINRYVCMCMFASYLIIAAKHIIWKCFKLIKIHLKKNPTPNIIPWNIFSSILTLLRVFNHEWIFRSHQIRSVTQSCQTLCHPMNSSTPGLPVHHQLPEFTETHVHRVSDAIQPSHPLSSPSPPAPNLFQHQSLFQ